MNEPKIKTLRNRLLRLLPAVAVVGLGWNAIGGCSSNAPDTETEQLGVQPGKSPTSPEPTCSADMENGALRIEVAASQKLAGNSNAGKASVAQGRAVVVQTDDEVSTNVTVKIGKRELQSIQTQISRNDGSMSSTITYGPPAQGVRVLRLDMDPSGNTVATFDGRRTLPFEAPTLTELEQLPEVIPNIQFEDGNPPPTFRLNALFSDNIASMLSTLTEQIGQCSQTLTESGGAPIGLLQATDPPHASDTDNNLDCLLEGGECHVAYLVCLETFTTASLLCGPFAPLCVAGSVAGCTVAEADCLDNAFESPECCPQLCADSFLDSRCCFSDESCLGDTGLCCSSGFTPCGDVLCCSSDATCFVAGDLVSCLEPTECDEPCETDADCSGGCGGGAQPVCGFTVDNCCGCPPT